MDANEQNDGSIDTTTRQRQIITGLKLLRILAAAVTVIMMTLPFLRVRLAAVANNYDVGHADPVAYSMQAHRLATGRGLKIPYVTNFYHRYDPSIMRREDHWFPGPAFIIAPMFVRHGRDAARARAAMVFTGTVLLPLAAAWLAAAATGKIWPALLTAGLVLGSSTLAALSTRITGDPALAALFFAYLAALLSSRKHPAWLIAAGLAGGMAYYMKGSQLILLLMLPFLAVMLHGLKILKSRWLAAGIGAYLALTGPWWIANTIDYGRPFHSTQNYVSAFFGLSERMWDDWGRNFYGVHWDEDLPRLTDRFRDPDALVFSMQRNSEIFTRYLLLGPDTAAHDWPRLGQSGINIHNALRDRDPPRRRGRRRNNPPDDLPLLTHPRAWPAWPYTIAQTAGLLWGGIALPLFAGLLIAKFTLRKKLPPPARLRNTARRLLMHASNSTVILAAATAQAFFIIVFWYTFDRFALLVVVPAIVLGCAFLCAIGSLTGLLPNLIPARFNQTARKYGLLVSNGLSAAGAVILCGTLICVWPAFSEGIVESQTKAAGLRFRDKPSYPQYYHIAQAMTPLVPEDAVIMSRNLWQLLFYGPDTWKAVGMPYADPEVIFSIARYYGVTHFLWDKNRPWLRAYMETAPEALEQIMEKPAKLYVIHYDRFPEGFLIPPDRIGRRIPPEG